MSRPARGEWIEMRILRSPVDLLGSRPARGEWIEISHSSKLPLSFTGLAPRGASGLK